MHILAVTDQHPQSLGGVQVSLRLQRNYLARAGHQLSIVGPKLHRPHEPERGDIELPSTPITPDREYAIFWPTQKNVRRVTEALGNQKIDVIHIQGDFWGALLGYRLASRLNLPVVHTMHNNVDEGTRAVSKLAPIAFWFLNCWRRWVLGKTQSEQKGAWRYLASLAERATVVVSPSAHFAAELRDHEVIGAVMVIPTGVDDNSIDEAAASKPNRKGEVSSEQRVRMIWLGRLSHEKRVMQFLAAVAEAQVPIEVEILGSGLLLGQVQRFLEQKDLLDVVRLRGSVSHAEALASIAAADVLVQTSIGFETQGMTVYEAAALGTPSIVSDPNIADDLNLTPMWRVRDDSVHALAETIREAAEALHGQPLRIAQELSATFKQSQQTHRMIRVYQQVISAKVGE